MMAGALLEVCVDDAEGLAAAVAGGADRIELCSALAVGGLTPAPGLMALAADCGLPVHAMIRPRAGHFRFTGVETRQMLAEIDAVRAAGLAGVVLGASLEDGRLDTGLLARLCAHAEGLDHTLHRAFDLVPDFSAAIAQAQSLGFDRILTSGGAASAAEGIEALQRIAAESLGRIAIMPGGGVSAANAAALLRLPGVTQLHSSGSEAAPAPAGTVLRLGFDIAGRRRTSARQVAAVRAAMG